MKPDPMMSARVFNPSVLKAGVAVKIKKGPRKLEKENELLSIIDANGGSIAGVVKKLNDNRMPTAVDILIVPNGKIGMYRIHAADVVANVVDLEVL